MILLLYLLSGAGLIAHAHAGSNVWPEYTLRGPNVAIHPGWPGHYSEEDIRNLAQNWKANAARVMVNNIVPGEAPYQVDETTKEDYFRLIDFCLKYKLYTIISFSTAFSDNDVLYNNSALKEAFKDFWVEVATRYADAEGVAYDLYNEPHDGLANTQWSAYAKTLTAAIRQVDSVHTIVVECPDWGWPAGFENLTPTGDPNTVYSFHFYGPMDYTHQRDGMGGFSISQTQWQQRPYPGTMTMGWGGTEYWDQNVMKRDYLNKALAFRDKYGVRLYCGEFGAARWAIGASQWYTDWIDLLEEENIDWTYYSYREWHVMDIEIESDDWSNAVVGTVERSSETELAKMMLSYLGRNIRWPDFDGDGRANVGDVLELMRFQRANPGDLRADFNGNGRANVVDAVALLLELMQNS